MCYNQRHYGGEYYRLGLYVMRSVKRIFLMYSADFWVFVLLIAALTALIRYSAMPIGNSVQTARVYVFAVATVICVLLMQINTRMNASPLSWLVLRAGKKFSSVYSHAELTNYHVSVLTLSALSVVFAAYILNAVISGRQISILAVFLIALAVILALLCICIINGISDRIRCPVIVVCMALPAVIELAENGLYFEAGYTPSTYIWLIAVLTFSMLLLNRSASKLLFKLFTCIIFAGILCELRFRPDADFTGTVSFFSNIFYIGFVIFAPMDFRMDRYLENYSALENINTELKETQTQLVQREQMVTLGQLIAGIAHEINTPIGAIKASAEMLDTLNFDKLLRDSKRFSDDAIEVLIILLDMCTRSMKNMRSTTDIRRGRAQVRQFIEGADIKRSDEIYLLLAEMEICDVEKVESNMDIFRRDDILDILTSARVLKPYVSSVQSINYASNGITKIIFALKSFSHMNTTGEKQPFDVIKNIDNVLVLYHNQIKRGIEIVKQYDEEVPHAFGNVEELSQVWTNIIQNAIHAMSYVGQLTITIKKSGVGYVSIAFTDTGIGIAPEGMARLFEPFYTTKPLGEGSGLGLDICKKVVEKNSGEIRVKSKPGHGATFTVMLPVAGHAVSSHPKEEMRIL